MNVTCTRGHAYILARGDVFPNRNAAVVSRCGYVTGYVNILLKGYITCLIYRHGQVPFRQGIACYVNTAVRCMQGQVAARIQLAILGDHDIIGSCAVIFIIQCFYGNIAFLRLCRAVHGDYTVRYIQVDIFLRQNRVFGRHFANFNIPVHRFYRHTGIGRSYRCLDCGTAVVCCNGHSAASSNLAGSVSFTNNNITGLRYVQFHLAAGRHVFANQNIAFAHSHVYILASGDAFPYRNTAVVSLRGYAAGYVNILLEINIAFIIHLHGQVMFCQCIARYINTAVRCMQSQVVARIQLAVMGDYNILGSYAILRVIQRLYSDIAFLGLCGAVHSNHAIHYLHVNIVLGQNRVFGVHLANIDIALLRFYRYAVIGGSNRSNNRRTAIFRCNVYLAASRYLASAVFFADGNIAGLRYVQFHVALGGYVFTYQDIASAHSHAYILACGNRLADNNIAFANLCDYAAGYAHVPLKGYTAFIVYRHVQVMFGKGVSRHVNAAIRSMQGQVVARIQLAVIGNHDILSGCSATFSIQRFHCNTASLLGLGSTVHGDYAVRYMQVNIVLGQNRIFGVHLANVNTALLRFYGYAVAGGSNRSNNCSTAVFR